MLKHQRLCIGGIARVGLMVCNYKAADAGASQCVGSQHHNHLVVAHLHIEVAGTAKVMSSFEALTVPATGGSPLARSRPRWLPILTPV